jgi:hypothetical protein
LTRIALLEEMYTSVRRMGLQILCSKALSRNGEIASKLWWDLDQSDGLQWLQITYALTYDSDPFNIGRLSTSEFTMVL